MSNQILMQLSNSFSPALGVKANRINENFNSNSSDMLMPASDKFENSR
ncbi:hypothetical protein [Candidatus Nitrosocosmicus sp. FF01]